MVSAARSDPPSQTASNPTGLSRTQPDSFAISSGRQRLAKRLRVAFIQPRQRGAGAISTSDAPGAEAWYAVSVIGSASVGVDAGA